MNLDTLIQQKIEDFENKFPIKPNSPHHSERFFSFKDEHVLKFLETTIREIAGMVVEEIVPEERNREKATWEGNIWFDGFEECRSELLATAKEKGFIN